MIKIKNPTLTPIIIGNFELKELFDGVGVVGGDGWW